MKLVTQHYEQLPSSTLYHYTTPDAFLGIIQNAEFWATQIQYMNDIKEFKHAVDLTVAMIDEVIKESGTSLFLKKLKTSVSQYDGARTFVVSFSEKADTLSQWRAYSRGGGYSIGFDHQKLITIARKQKWSLLPCIYDELRQRELIKELINYALNEWSSVSGPSSEEDVSHYLARKFYGKFMRLAPNIKHPAFSEECEWRLIGGPFSYNREEAGWRSARGMLIPYHRFSLLGQDGFLPITEVHIGPHSHIYESANSVRSFLNSRPAMSRENLAQVRLSNAPFRE